MVFLLGADELATGTQDRATFYVGATRAKLHLIVTGVRRKEPTLFDEVLAAAKALAGQDQAVPVAAAPPSPAAAGAGGAQGKVAVNKCRHCGSERLHAQFGRNYYYVCIDCTQNTAMRYECAGCGKRARVRKAKNEFHRECDACGRKELLHVNVPLGSLFD